MNKGFGLGIGLMIASIASAAYWLGVLALLERATSFDYTHGGEPNETLVIIKVGLVLVAGPLIYAAILLAASGARRGRAIAAAIGFGVLAGLYWAAVAIFIYGVTASDTREGVSPDRAWQRGALYVTLVIAPLVFALILRGWRRVARRPGTGVSDA